MENPYTVPHESPVLAHLFTLYFLKKIFLKDHVSHTGLEPGSQSVPAFVLV